MKNTGKKGNVNKYKLVTLQDSRGYFTKVTIFNFDKDPNYYMTFNYEIHRVYKVNDNLFRVKNRRVDLTKHKNFQKV